MIDPYIGAIIVTVLAGITWTCFGYLNAWRKNHQNEDWKGFDKVKLRNDAILGGILGVATILAAPIVAGTALAYNLPVVDSFESFVLGVAAMIGPIAIVDKFLVGGVLGIKN